MSLEHIQAQLNKLDVVYRSENEKLISAMGTKYYKLDKEKAHSAMLLTFANLEMSIENQDVKSGYINARGTMPRPLGKEEFDRAWAIEKPRAKEITGLDLSMSGNSDVIINSFIVERGDGIQINIRFRTKYTGNTYGIVISDQAPPEAVKIAYPKIWNEFEKVAFIQGKVVYGDNSKK
jgi:hypothetical protein